MPHPQVQTFFLGSLELAQYLPFDGLVGHGDGRLLGRIDIDVEVLGRFTRPCAVSATA
jgi:hypothetical protein